MSNDLSWHPDHVTALGSLVIEPSFFGSVSKFTFELLDKEMSDLVAFSRYHISNFCITEHFGLPVVVRL